MDLTKLTSLTVFGTHSPEALFRGVWFYIQLYWCRRGGEAQRELTTNSFELKKDVDGTLYATMTLDEFSKNHQGTDSENPSFESLTRMYDSGIENDGFHLLKLYLEKINPSCSSLFQFASASIQMVSSRSSVVSE